MSTVTPRPVVIARAIAIAACVLYALVATWELFAPLPGGHLGNAAGAAMAGENMLHHRFLGAVLEYVPARPIPAQHYTHHPYGVFVLSALAHAVVGHGWVATKLPAVLLSIASPPLLWLLARALYGELAAAVATAVFVVVPVNLAYATFHNLEVPLIAAGLLFAWCTVRFFQTDERRFAIGSVLGALFTCHVDWIGMVLVGGVGTLAFVRVYVLPERLRRAVDPTRHAAWFAWTVAVSTGTLLFYLLHFGKLGRLGDLFGAYEHRAAGSSAALGAIFGPRRLLWLLWMLPATALLGLVAGTFVATLRSFRRFEEWVAPVWCGTACIQYFAFRNGADTHVFWPHMASVSVALGVAVVAASVHEAVSAFRSERLAHVLAFVPSVLAVVILARVGFPLAHQSRLSGGRFDDGGRYIGVDQDRHVFAAWAATVLAKDRTIGLHRSFDRTWAVEYAIGRPLAGKADVLLADARRLAGAELTAASATHAVTAVGPYLTLSRTGTPGWTSLAFHERQPALYERWLGTSTDLVRSVGDVDAFATHEWREHLGLATTLPRVAPATPEEARIAFNTGRDPAHRQKALELVSARLDVPFSGGVRLVGAHVDAGAATVVTLLWETSDDHEPGDADFLVRSRVTAPPRLWPSRVDFFEKELAPPMALRPALWKPGRLYVQRFVAMRRLGEEAVWGVWSVRGGTARTPSGPLADGESVKLWVWPR